MYNELSHFYAVANRYEQETCIGMHSDFNVCYVVPPSTKWSSVATLWQMGSCGLAQKRIPSNTLCMTTHALTGFKRNGTEGPRTVVSCVTMPKKTW